MNGADNAPYDNSTSSSSGTYTLTVTFALGTDTDIDQVIVQNRAVQANAQVPPTVAQESMIIKEQHSSLTLTVNLFSPDNRYGQVLISNHTDINLIYPLSRIRAWAARRTFPT